MSFLQTLAAAFTGLMPLEQTCEEILPVQSGWQVLNARPVHWRLTS